MESAYIAKATDLKAVADAIRAKGETSGQLVFPAGFVTAIQNMKGGAELNFEIVGGTTRPSNPKINTIWVETSAVTAFGLCTDEPSNPVEGMVWINLVSAEEQPDAPVLRIVKDETIIARLCNCQKYSGGSWSDQHAEIYVDGAWVEIPNNVYIVKDGVVSSQYTFEAYHGTPQITTNNNALYIAMTNNGYTTVYTRNKIPTKGFSYALIEVADGSSPYNISFGVLENKASFSDENTSPFGANKVSVTGKPIVPQTVRLDLSAYENPMWFGISIAGTNTMNDANFLRGGVAIKNIKLVR